MKSIHCFFFAAALCGVISANGQTPHTPQSPPGPAAGSAPAEAPSSPALRNEPERWLQPFESHGVKFQVSYIGEVLSNLSGGYRRGAIYEGLLNAGVQLDLEKLCGWKGGDLFANMLYPHGSSLTQTYTRDFNGVSSIDAYDSARLNELWFEQHLAEDQFSVRIGMLAADSEFFVCDSSAFFVNGSFSTLPLVSFDVDSPVFPLTAPGARVQWAPTKSFTARAGIFGGSAGDPTTNNRHGLRFRLGPDEGALILAETEYKTNTAGNATGLPGTFKLGGFYHTGKFEDFETGKSRRGNYGLYAIADQTLYREPCACRSAKSGKDGDADNDQGLNIFAHIGGAPDDRNIVSAYFDAGLHYKGLLPGRDDDVCAVACSYTRISDDFQSGEPEPRHHETVLEFTYQAVLTPWLSVQPDVQYIFNPGAVLKQDDALVAGVRMNLTF